MRIKFSATVQEKKKYDYYNKKRYTYTQKFIFLPKELTKKIKSGKRINIIISF